MSNSKWCRNQERDSQRRSTRGENGQHQLPWSGIESPPHEYITLRRAQGRKILGNYMLYKLVP